MEKQIEKERILVLLNEREKEVEKQELGMMSLEVKCVTY